MALAAALSRPVEFVLQGNDYDELPIGVTALLFGSENPGLVRIDHDYKETFPQFLVSIETKPT